MLGILFLLSLVSITDGSLNSAAHFPANLNIPKSHIPYLFMSKPFIDKCETVKACKTKVKLYFASSSFCYTMPRSVDRSRNKVQVYYALISVKIVYRKPENFCFFFFFYSIWTVFSGAGDTKKDVSSKTVSPLRQFDATTSAKKSQCIWLSSSNFSIFRSQIW